MESSTVRIRPLRLAFLVKPSDRDGLRRIFEINSGLWGGIYNFIIPYFRVLPKRYHEQYVRKQVTALEMMKGLLDAFQPDLLIEMTPGIALTLGFDPKRTLSPDDLIVRDERGRSVYGIDMRTLCEELYEKQFMFLRRHPPKVIVPRCKDERYRMLFTMLFGAFEGTGNTSDFTRHFHDALGGETEVLEPEQFPDVFKNKSVFPLRVTAYELGTTRQSWLTDSKLYYMDENDPYDLIEFWNLRAIGWDIAPLPASLAQKLTSYSEGFVQSLYERQKESQNARYFASFMCARSQDFDSLTSYIGQLRLPTTDSVSLDPRLPRLWEEWGRNADHAEPQIVTHSTKTVDASLIGEGLHIKAAIPDFLKHDDFASANAACANVLEQVVGGAAVIPWNKNLTSLIHDFGEEKTYVSRDGVVLTAGEFSSFRFLRIPSPQNVFSALAEGLGYTLSLSPAGRTCQQIIKALGGLAMIRMVARSAEFIKFLNRIAHEDVEVEIDVVEDKERKRKKVSKSYATYNEVQREIGKANAEHPALGETHLAALIRQNVLRVGLTLRCPECHHTSWFELHRLASMFTCPRCSNEFPFPSANPPDRSDWAYKLSGPFAAENFGYGSYCVAAALNLLSNDWHNKTTWITSFEMKPKDKKSTPFEADFGIFIAPTMMTHASSPTFVIGEGKSFNLFENRDFERARQAAALFPGAVLCFATFREQLTPGEKRRMRALASVARKSRATGQKTNPVLVLTGKELFGQFRLRGLYDAYGTKKQYARGIFARGDMQELCDFTQQLYLDMPSYHQWREEDHKKRTSKSSGPKLGGPSRT